ncbi:outer membrane protein assembly factor BamB family protein [Aeoliella sp. SH292]|uniref:outer membrane protein assembly factor BamB family protein n=1 Tax=Aeoliella sp. SH292 TaxID=3454464 RepID=UPI003F9C49C8
MLLRNLATVLLASVGLFGWTSVCVAEAPAPGDWPQWRGAAGDNKAVAEGPLEWGEDKNIVWRVPVPGRGHSSPTVVGDKVFLTTADETAKTQSVLAFDRQTGDELWSKQVFAGGLDHRMHQRNTHATCSVACAGDQLFALFLNRDAIWMVSFDTDGNELWRSEVGPYESHWGYSASPMIYGDNVLVTADHPDGGWIAAVAQSNGDLVWKTGRDKNPNYPSPVVHHVSGQDQLLLAGLDRVASYSPETGKLLWEAKGTTTECVGTVVVDGDLAFASGGYPDSETLAVATDGSGRVAWKNRVKVYVPSLLAHAGRLYAVTDDGIAYCWDAASGDQKWKKRLGGTFNTSPVLVGDCVVAACEDGTTYVLRAADKYELVAENQLGNEVYATPTFCGGQAFIRYAVLDGQERQEFLACIGQE